MTPEEIAHARAEYDALAGTPSDRASYCHDSDMQGRDVNLVIQAMALKLGGAFYRATKTDAGVWVEAWDERPHKQADFDAKGLCERRILLHRGALRP